MDTIDIARKNLDIILKNGDLYDTIALKEGVKPATNTFLKLHIFLLSRILYGGVFIHQRVKSHFAPINKVKKAQEEIRKILGFNVDIIRSKAIRRNTKLEKKELPSLSLLYETENIEIEQYTENLQKIMHFCELHSINEILLRAKDIINLTNDPKIYCFKDKFMTDILDDILITIDRPDEWLLSLSHTDLLKLIEILDKTQVNQQFILELGEKIKDITIKKAIEEFATTKNVEKLKRVVVARLTLIFNSESVYKDKINGKIYKTITIKETYVKVMSYNKNHEIISNRIMTLYEYLGVFNDQTLMEQIEKSRDDKDVLLIASLYLYLCNNKKIKKHTKENNITFYDKIYTQFEEKRKKKIKQIQEMHSQDYKFLEDLKSLAASCYTTIKLLTFALLPLIPIKLVETKDNQILEKTIETISLPYRKSFDLEKKLILKLANMVKNRTLDFISFTGDLFDDNNENKIIAEIVETVNSKNHTKEGQMPKYYATGYATDATYQNGQVGYTMTHTYIDFQKFQNVEAIFKIRCDISRKSLGSAIQNNEINLVHEVYPLGKNYVLTNIRIIDLEDKNKKLIIDSQRASTLGKKITEEEQKLLSSMEKPEIWYTYGISQDIENAFVTMLEKTTSYTSLSRDEIKEAIISGLELDNTTSLEEIVETIKNKTYSKTPIKNAGLSSKIEKMDEKEYYETIASLDSLICNLAASLVVAVDEELIYVVGYMNDGDDFITQQEGHAWAMRKDGTIIDATPSTIAETENEVKKAIENIIDWGNQNNIGVYIVISCIVTSIGIYLQEMFGAKITWTLKVMKTKKIVNTPKIEESYAKINETLYGGINIPRKITPSELVEKIEKEFASFSKEELQELKKQIQIGEFESKKQRENALKIIDEIPFIKENAENLQKVLTKRKQ